MQEVPGSNPGSPLPFYNSTLLHLCQERLELRTFQPHRRCHAHHSLLLLLFEVLDIVKPRVARHTLDCLRRRFLLLGLFYFFIFIVDGRGLFRRQIDLLVLLNIIARLGLSTEALLVRQLHTHHGLELLEHLVVDFLFPLPI